MAVASGVSEAERQLVLAEGERRGWPAAELDAAISIESGWNPAAHHPVTKAGGLIGFMPFILPKLGWTAGPEAFWKLSAAAQAPFVGKYLDAIDKRWRVPGDTYLAVAAPSFVGASDSVEVYPRGGKAWELNPGWRGADGRITAGSIRAVLLRRMGKGPARLSRGGGPFPLGVVLAGLGVWWLFRKGRRRGACPFK